MRPEQIEAWVLSVVDRVKNGQRVEDSRVELKSSWPDVQSAARRVAGHANAAGGDPVLWIIGLDEQKGIVPFKALDPAQWRGQLAPQFDGVEPSCTDVIVPTVDGPVVALLFDSSRRPYVVKNPVFGASGGGPVSLEVPWRSGTSVRSAQREELIRMLVPLQALPAVELLQATASVNKRPAVGPDLGNQPPTVQQAEHLQWDIRIVLYITPRTSDLLALPVHKTVMQFGFRVASMAAEGVRLFPPYFHTSSGFRSDSQTITATSAEAIVTGPGRLYVEGHYYEVPRALAEDSNLAVALLMTPAGQDRSLSIAADLIEVGREGDVKRSWRWAEGDESA